jgi:hypothetical protein
MTEKETKTRINSNTLTEKKTTTKASHPSKVFYAEKNG